MSGGNFVGGERMHHADLNRAKTAAAGEHKGGFRPTGLISYQGNLVRSRYRRARKNARDARAFIAADSVSAPSTMIVDARDHLDRSEA